MKCLVAIIAQPGAGWIAVEAGGSHPSRPSGASIHSKAANFSLRIYTPNLAKKVQKLRIAIQASMP